MVRPCNSYGEWWLFVDDASTPQPELEAYPPRALVKDDIQLRCIARVATGTDITFTWEFQNSTIIPVIVLFIYVM